MFLFERVVFSSVLTLVAGVAHAGFGTCTLANNVLAAGTDPVDYVRLAMRDDGRPVLAYTTDVHNNSSLYLYDCANPACSAGHVVYLDTSSNYYGAPGILVRPDGRPLVIATWFGGIRLYDCADADCVGYSLHDIRANASAIFSDIPLVLQANGNPMLLYLDGVLGSRPGYLIVHFCGDATCDTGATEQVLAMPPPATPMFSALSLARGGDQTLAAAYLSSVGASNLNTYNIARCADAACTSVTNTQVAAPVGDSTSVRTALAMRSDLRPLALDSQANNRVLLDCTTSACSAWNDRPLPTTGQPLGLKLLTGDVPAYALFDSPTVSAIACNDTGCSMGNGVVASTSTSNILDGDFALDANARPVVAYIDFDTRTLAVAGCKADVMFIDGFD
jgi:hypothetical protein